MLVPSFKLYPFKFFLPLVEYLFAITWFNRKILACINKEEGDLYNVGINFLSYLDIKISIDFPERAPKNGQVQVIANHDGELLDGLVMLAVCGKIRKDFKLLIAIESKDITLFRPFCFYTHANSKAKTSDREAKKFHELASFLNNGNALCYFPFIFRFFKENKNLRHIVSPLPYYLAKKTSTPILPLRFNFEKTIFGRLLLTLKQACIKSGWPKLAFFFGIIEVLFSLHALRAMQGKTVYVKIYPLVHPPLKKLSKLQAMDFVRYIMES